MSAFELVALVALVGAALAGLVIASRNSARPRGGNPGPHSDSGAWSGNATDGSTFHGGGHHSGGHDSGSHHSGGHDSGSHHSGGDSSGDSGSGVLQRAPSRKARMDVLKRDRFRCKACGRSPHNNTDIELHVHHIIPWGGGGLTETDNLITLCMTCHDGLDPHYEPRLFELIDKTWNSEDIGSLHDEHVREYAEGVMRYRVKMGRLFEQMAEQKKTSKRLPVVARKRR